MKPLLISLAVLVATVQMSAAQHLQQELLSGSEKMVLQTTFSQAFGPESDFRINGLAFFNRFHDPAKRAFDEAVVQTSVTGSFSKHFSAGPNLFYSSVAGLQPGMLFNAHYRIAGFDISLRPQVAYNVPTDAIQGGVALLIRKMVPLNRRWSIGGNAFLMGSWLRFKSHDRSIIQARVGPVYKQHFQFGVSYDLDQYSSQILQQNQFGLFVRALFN